jgi:putative membrane protein
MKNSHRVFQRAKLGALTAAALVLAALTRTTDAKASPTAPEKALADPEIVQYVLDADKYEQQASAAAKSAASTPAVRELAEQLGMEHSSLDQEFKSLGLAGSASDLDAKLAASSQQRLAWLRGMTGEQFEETYADYEVNFHKSLLDTLDQVLLRDAKDNGLQARLQELRDKTEMHLADAEQVKEITDQRRWLRDSP